MPDATVVSLFTGIGGLDAGLHAAGFKVVAAVEQDPTARKVLSRIRPSWRLLDEPNACALTREHWANHLGKVEVDLLAGGPPCQPFSHAASWARPESAFDDARADTIGAYFKTARWLLPRVLVMESVPGLAHRHLHRLRSFLGAINRENGTQYRWQTFQICATDWGIPQARRRVILVADRDGRELQLPPPTHAEHPNEHQLPITTAWDALGPLDEPEWIPELAPTGRWAGLLPSIPEGENYLFHTRRGAGEPLFGWRTRYWAFLLKLSKRRPAWTLSANPGPAHGPFHWANRRLSERELAALQTFPLRTALDVSAHQAQRLLGNAVPSALGELFGRLIGRQLLGRRWSSTLHLVPENSAAWPRAARAKAVPAEFRKRRPPADHPGEGKGPGASLRLAAGR